VRRAIRSLILSNYSRLGLILAITAISLYLVMREATLQEIWHVLQQVNWVWIGLALATMLVNILLKAMRWRVLLGQPGENLCFRSIFMSLVAGQYLNMLYPARVGDISRVYVIGGLGAGRAYTLGTVLVEKILDLIAYSSLFLLLVVLMPLPAWVSDSGYTFTLIVLVVCLGVVVMTLRREWFLGLLERMLSWLPGRLLGYTIERLRSGLASLEMLQARGKLYQLAVWTALIWWVAVLTNQLTILALDLSLPIKASILVLILLQAGITIPSVPGRVGVFEAICLVALGMFAVEQATALSFGILLHGVVLMPTLLIGIISSWILGLGNRALEAEERRSV